LELRKEEGRRRLRDDRIREEIAHVRELTLKN
jgi:hypothetical protein